MSLSLIVSEELSGQGYIEFNDHAHFLRPWGSGTETKCQVHNQTMDQVKCKKNQLSISNSFRGVVRTRIVYGQTDRQTDGQTDRQTDGQTDGRRTKGDRISSTGLRPVELKILTKIAYCYQWPIFIRKSKFVCFNYGYVLVEISIPMHLNE